MRTHRTTGGTHTFYEREKTKETLVRRSRHQAHRWDERVYVDVAGRMMPGMYELFFFLLYVAPQTYHGHQRAWISSLIISKMSSPWSPQVAGTQHNLKRGNTEGRGAAQLRSCKNIIVSCRNVWLLYLWGRGPTTNTSTHRYY